MSAEIVQFARPIELPNSEFIFGRTAGMCEVRKRIEGALQDDLPVLIEGESGTGKEVIGRFLHQHSRWAKGPFIKLNCGAMPARLLEEEIFGDGQGAENGERPVRSGSRTQAPGATLFLDEVGDLDIALQRRLMQALESSGSRSAPGPEYQSTRGRRFICATSIDLESALGDRPFLRELLACFGQRRVVLVPLRERKEDIPQLCDYLIQKFARDFSRPAPKLSSYAVEAFQQWKWPGNIRELENWIARIVIFGTEEVIGRDFRRQLVDWGAVPPRRHRALRMKTERPRRGRGGR
jgi:DNA-binding NtrC family response regulator